VTGELQLQMVVISLASASDRRKQVAERFAASAIPWRFEDARTGDGSVVPYDAKAAHANKGRDLFRSEIGCFESHVSVLRKFVADQSAAFMIVCEDDVWIDFGFQFEELIDAMHEAGVHYVRLYSRRVAPVRHIRFWHNRWLVRYLWEPFGTQCYLISKAGAETILGNFKSIGRPIDDELDRFWENGLPAYSIFPHPVIELQSSSSILRLPVAQSRVTRMRLAARRGWDRLVALGYALRTTETDRRFAQALARRRSAEVEIHSEESSSRAV